MLVCVICTARDGCHVDAQALIKALAQTKPPNGVKRILEAMERSLNATATKTQSK